MRKLRFDILPFLVLLTLCVITLDESKFSAGRYHLRWSYFGYAGMAFSWLLPAVRGFLRKSRSLATDTFREVVRSPWFLCFAAMMAVGVLGTSLNSVNPHRSWAFLLWDTATLLSVPAVMLWVSRNERERPAEWLGILTAILLLIISHDLLTCSLKTGAAYWGRMVEDPPGVCRPRAWYQEPNYLSSFFLFCYLVFFAQKPTTWKWHVCKALALIGTVFTTSRTGWIAVGGVLLIEGAGLAFHTKWRKRLIWVALPVIAGVALAATTPIFDFPIRSFAKIQSDRSAQERVLAGQAALVSWKDHPWVGVGPGASGAYFVEHWTGHPYRKYIDVHRWDEKPEVFRNDPLSKDLITEVLGEWGSLGAILFIAGLVAWFLPLIRAFEPGFPRYYAAFLLGWILFCVYATSQTLPRFDLWFLLGLAGASGRCSRDVI